MTLSAREQRLLAGYCQLSTLNHVSVKRFVLMGNRHLMMPLATSSLSAFSPPFCAISCWLTIFLKSSQPYTYFELECL